MIAFEVHVNGQRLCTAGVNGDGATNIIMNWVRRRGLQTQSHLPDSVEEELRMHVGGLETSTKEHVIWENLDLKPGDRIEIVVLETDSADTPRERFRFDQPTS